MIIYGHDRSSVFRIGELDLDSVFPAWWAALLMLAVVVAGANFVVGIMTPPPTPDGLERLNSFDDPIGIYLNTETGCEWSGRSIGSLSQHLDANGKPVCRSKQ